MEGTEKKLKFVEFHPKFNDLEEMSAFLKEDHGIRSRFKIILLIGSSSDTQEVISEYKLYYDVLKTEDFYQIKKIDEKDKSLSFLGYLWFLPETTSSILFTFSSSKSIRRYFFRYFINKNSNINLLWLTHKLTIELMNHFIQKHYTTINFIEGIYSPSYSEKSSRRPNFDRKIKYEGKDAYFSFYELKDAYGINIENFEGILNGFSVGFNRKEATIYSKVGKLNTLISISQWLFDKAKSYLDVIRKFKKEIYKSIFLNRKYNLSNNLIMNFEHSLSTDVLNEMIKMIELSKEIYVISINKIEIDESTVFKLELNNRYKKGIFHLIINSEFVKINQIVKSNFIGVFPVLDIFDYTQPANKIIIY